MSALHEVLSRLQTAGFKLKAKPKCKFALSDGIFLGIQLAKVVFLPQVTELNSYLRGHHFTVECDH